VLSGGGVVAESVSRSPDLVSPLGSSHLGPPILRAQEDEPPSLSGHSGLQGRPRPTSGVRTASSTAKAGPGATPSTTGPARVVAHTNARGDVVSLTDRENGYPIVATYRYGPWGELLSAEGTCAGQPIRYASYVYGNDNPLRYVDPSGAVSTERSSEESSLVAIIVYVPDPNAWDGLTLGQLNLVLSIVGAVAATAVFLVVGPAALVLTGVGLACGVGTAVVSVLQYNNGEITARECIFSVGSATVDICGGAVGALARHLMTTTAAGIMFGAALSMQVSLCGAAVAGASLAP